MRGETLIQQHPLTPPNAGADYRNHPSQYNTDRHSSFNEGAYGSPGSATHHVDVHSQNTHGHGVQYEGYGPAGEYYHNGEYNGVPANQGIFSPPTPRSTTDYTSPQRTTRSRRVVAPSSSPAKAEPAARPKATPRSRKAKAGKGEKPKTPKLTAPLSILTKELYHIPVKNMEEWVNRPAETRRKEVEKRNGYITRPMNSFMLYRSAYADRAKSWCLQNNHQVVSSVAGESWPLEPPEIRELYNEYAKIERINHQNAHPTYKFSPSKTPAPARKRKGEWSDDEEPSDLDDAEWAPSSGRARPRQARRIDRSFDYHTNGVDAEYFSGGMNRSSWEMTNEGRPMPMPMGHNDMYNQYYQTPAYPGMPLDLNFAEDMRMRRVDTPASSVHLQTNQGLIGLPGGNAFDWMQQLHSQSGTPFEEGQLDPMLLTYDSGTHGGINPAALQQHGFRNSRSSITEDGFEDRSLDALLELESPHAEYHSASWQPDPTMTSLEQESEFDKWMGEH